MVLIHLTDCDGFVPAFSVYFPPRMLDIEIHNINHFDVQSSFSHISCHMTLAAPSIRVLEHHFQVRVDRIDGFPSLSALAQ